MKLPHSRLMFVEFERIFAQFDYDSYNKIISDRTKNSLGNDKASDLIIEIAIISSYFVSDKIRKKINPNASVYMAFYGWTLSDEKVFSNKDYCKLDKFLKKNISSCAKTVAYESDYTNKTEICWIIFNNRRNNIMPFNGQLFNIVYINKIIVNEQIFNFVQPSSGNVIFK